MRAKATRAPRPRGIKMPADTRWLYTHGHLTPADAEALGAPVMNCANCKQPVTLVTTCEPIPEEQLAATTLPALVWSRDVVVMCPACSFKPKGATV